MAEVEKQVAAALERLPSLDQGQLLTLRKNALRFGDAAAPLLAAIDERLSSFAADGGMSAHRLEFARIMLRKVMGARVHERIASRDLFLQAKAENPDHPYVRWMAGNSARQIPLTKALHEVESEFPDLERSKDGSGQGDRVWYRRLR